MSPSLFAQNKPADAAAVKQLVITWLKAGN